MSLYIVDTNESLQHGLQHCHECAWVLSEWKVQYVHLHPPDQFMSWPTNWRD